MSSQTDPTGQVPLPVPPATTARTLGRYELRYELAAGGMGTVYLAKVMAGGGFDKLVALKTIHTHLASEPDFVEMFLDEARIASRLSHPNICPVFDFGVHDGTYYLAMEYLMGESLSKVLRQVAKVDRVASGHTNLPRYVAYLIAEACEGLHAAHEVKDDTGNLLGLVHRDISPGNIFVCFDGSVRVVDFGVATIEGKLHHTQSGAIKGKFAYMSPEQVERLPIDRRVDVFALGICLWEGLTLRRLFRRDDQLATIMALREDTITPPSEHNPLVPAALDRIVMKALARDRDERYASARELARSLKGWIGRQSEPTDMTEIAEWMTSLLADEHDAQVKLVRRARSKAVPALKLDRSSSEIDIQVEGEAEARTGVTRREPPTPAERTPTPAPSPDRLSPPEPAPPGVRRGTVAAIVAVALLVGIGSTALVLSSAGPDAAPVPVLDSSSAAEAPALVETRIAPAVPIPAATAVPDEPAIPPEAPVRTVTPPSDAPDVSEPPATAGGRRHPARPRAAPAEAAASAQPSLPGSVTIVATGGWADVSVDGRPMGRTPRVLSLAAGEHTVTLRPFGRDPAVERRVTVPAGGSARVVQAVEAPAE